MTTLVNEAYCDEPVDKSVFLLKQTHTVLHVLFMIRIYIKYCICVYVCVSAYEITDVTERSEV